MCAGARGNGNRCGHAVFSGIKENTMRTTLVLALALLAPLPALAEGGDRMPAGGAFMSSYVRDPYPPRGPGAPFSRGSVGTPDVSATATVPDAAGPRARTRRR